MLDIEIGALALFNAIFVIDATHSFAIDSMPVLNCVIHPTP